jgi:hypothetical protein
MDILSMDHYLGAVPQLLLDIGRTTARLHEVQAYSLQEGFGVLRERKVRARAKGENYSIQQML